jgi:MOSC domain-containing protein YiiM
MGKLANVWLKRFKRGPMDPQDRATLRAGAGLVGNADQGGRRQVTLLSAERWAEAERELGAAVDPRGRRANLMLTGIDLEETRDRVLRIGGCRLRILGETRPCARMEEAHPGLRQALEPHWRAGAFGEVLDDGEIAVGDEVGWES